MAEPVAYAVYGSIYLNPDAADDGSGTLLPGMDMAQPITVLFPTAVEEEIHGLERDAVRAVGQMVPQEDARIAVPAQGGDVDTLTLMFAPYTTDGAPVATDEEGVPAGWPMPGTPAVLRPRDNSEPFFYFPSLQLHSSAALLFNRHPRIKQLAGSALVLLCGKPETEDLPGAFMGTPEEIDAMFFPEESPPPEVS